MRKKHLKKRDSQGPLKRFAKCIDLPDFAQGAEECIEIWGSNTVLIEGAKGIHTYERELIKVRLKKRILVLRGSDFDLAHFGDGGLRIVGQLRIVEWEE